MDVINCPECGTRVKYMPGGFCPGCAIPLDEAIRAHSGKASGTKTEGSGTSDDPMYIADDPSAATEQEVQDFLNRSSIAQSYPIWSDPNDARRAEWPTENGAGLLWILFRFNGRIPRRVFWWSLLGVMVVFSMMDGAFDTYKHFFYDNYRSPTYGGYVDDTGRGYGTGHFEEPVYYSSMRRNPEPAWVALIDLAIKLFFIYLAAAICAKRFHDIDKSGAWVWIVLIPCVGIMILMLDCGFARGTLGANQYGPDPT